MLESDKNISLSATNLTLSTSTDNAPSGKTAKKVIMSELERLISLLEEVQDAKSGDTSNNTKALNLLKKIGQGKGTDSDKSAAIDALKSTIIKDGGNITSLISMVQESLQDAPKTKEAKAYLNTAKQNMKALSKGIKNGETSLKEIFDNENTKAFMSGLTGTAGASNAKTESADDEHRQNMLNFAVGLQSLLSDIYKLQIDQGDTYSDALKTQITNIYNTTVEKNKDLMSEMADQTKAASKPWYMYLIAGVVAAVGAVVAFFTAGAAVAVVGVVVAAIMISPIGDAITNGLTKMFLGNNANPTDAQKTGASIGATAIVTLITTLLSMGGSAVTSVTDGVADGVAEGVSAAAEAGSELGNAVTEGVATSASEAATRAGSSAAEGLEESEEAVEEAVEESLEDVSGDDENEDTEATKSGKKRLTFDKGAFKEALGERFLGTYVQGFLGSGGLTEIAELIIPLVPGGKDWLNTEAGADIMAGISAALTIAGSIATAKLVTEPALKLRSGYLNENGFEDAPAELTKPWSMALNSISLLAQGANAGVGVVKFVQWKKTADAAEVLAAVEASLVPLTGAQQDMTTQRDDMNKAYGQIESSVTDSIKEVLDTIGSDQGTLARQISG